MAHSSSNSVYGGAQLTKCNITRLGITTTFVDPSNPENFAEAVQRIQGIFAESGKSKLDI